MSKAAKQFLMDQFLLIIPVRDLDPVPFGELDDGLFIEEEENNDPDWAVYNKL